MEMNLTLIVALLGGSAALFFGFKGKLSGLLKGRQEAHKDKQELVKGEVSKTKDLIEEQQERIKALQEKSKKAEEIINEISKSNNEEVKKILKEKDTDRLIEEFKKW